MRNYDQEEAQTSSESEEANNEDFIGDPDAQDRLKVSLSEAFRFIGDRIGVESDTNSALTISVSLPVEILLEIVRCADTSQYGTLRMVCKTWKSELYKSLRKRYCEPRRPDKGWILQNFHDSWYSPVSPENSPVLIHSALWHIIPYLQGWVNRATEEFIFGKVYSKPTFDDDMILANTKEFKRYANDPILISNTEDPGPLPLDIYMSYTKWRFDIKKIASMGQRLQVHQTMSIKQLLYLMFSGVNEWRLRGEAEANEANERLSYFFITNMNSQMIHIALRDV
ncbi:hypothetical protein TWF694_009052 [Orbilia ellipsospora]|uniref:F-box domain-containing protein n=1 Tax=Orbilia ellipsospora TaxID=2528407 RepID=A0AAV9XF56_9PEZI